MNSARVFVIAAVGVILSGHLASAQDLSRYRGYVLESSVAAVSAISTALASDAKTLHQRPAQIQELEWRTPYGSSSELADPVRQVTFTFFNDALYQVVVAYDRGRTEGLTNNDVIESLTATYGAPVLASTKMRTSAPAEALSDGIVLARWENATASLTLVKGTYSPEFQLILISKALSLQARSAIREAVRLDAVEAPRRESDQRKKELADANASRDKTRTTNKAAFRP